MSSRSKIKPRLLVVMLVLLTILTSEASATCKRRPSVQTITINECIPKRLLTYTCSGICSRHAHISSTNPFDITRTCYQGKETALRDRRVKIKCPSEEGPLRFIEVYMTVKVPGGCICENSSVIDNNQQQS